MKRCLFCGKEIESQRKKYCDNYCKGYYHRYKFEYPNGFTPELAVAIKERSNRGRRKKNPKDKSYPINIPIHKDDFPVIQNFSNFKNVIFDELKIFLLCEFYQIAKIIDKTNPSLALKSRDYHNYTLYVPLHIKDNIDKLSSKLLRTRRNLLTIFSLYFFSKNI
jgi:hypothetical protein